jgi:hypothetical protein
VTFRGHLEVIPEFSGVSMENLLHQGFIYSPTDPLVSCLKNNIKIYIKTAPTCFGAVAPSSGSGLIHAY